MTKILLAALIIFLTFPSFLRAGSELNTDQFTAICSKAKDLDDTPEGQAYETPFTEAITADMQKALIACADHSKPSYLVNLVFVIGGNGKVEHIFAEPGHPVSACVAAKLTGQKVPKPPKPEWLLLVNINIHE